jgi:mono/diheme cytochrome c family protein
LKGNTLRRKHQSTIFVLVLLLMVLITGCFRGRPSEDPPIHINPNMDDQPKYKAQSESYFFENGSAMREPIPGTVARDEAYDNPEYYLGKDKSGNLIDKIPVPVTIQLLERGQERFNIYCAPCHSRIGDGKGIVVQRGYMPPPNFHQDNIRAFPDGHIFDVISNGIRNMPTYGHMIPVADRWAIVAYFRALQRSEHASINDVPAEMRNEIK